MMMKRSSRPWSDDEIRRMLDMADRGVPYREIGATLGRTAQAVAFKRCQVNRNGLLR